jgi:ABC-type polysaccharide/polyol phosphate export permease
MFYGIAQAGSHLIWNLSSGYFSKDQDSTPYTALNILLQGIRGCFAPLLGGLMTQLMGPLIVLITGAMIAFFGMVVMIRNNQKMTSN